MSSRAASLLRRVHDSFELGFRPSGGGPGGAAGIPEPDVSSFCQLVWRRLRNGMRSATGGGVVRVVHYSYTDDWWSALPAVVDSVSRVRRVKDGLILEARLQ